MSRDLVAKIVKELEGKVYYGDVRLETGVGQGCSKSKTKESLSFASSVGLAVRISSGNRWYYLGFDRLDEAKILEEVRKLAGKAGNMKSDIVLQDPWKLDEEVRVKENPAKQWVTTR
jgi:predicted Zn-dependent protease